MQNNYDYKFNIIQADRFNLASSHTHIGIINEAKCKCDYANEIFNHKLRRCALRDAQRRKLIQKMIRSKLNLPLASNTI